MLQHYQPPLTPYLQVLYQDQHIVVLNKPSGLLSVPGKDPAHRDSLEWRVRLVWPNICLVHRLDMATSGILVMAHHKSAQRELNRQFAGRLTEKHYIAVVAGQVQADQGCIDLPLICDWPNRPKQKICFEYGKASQTCFQVLQRNTLTSRLQLTPITGRSHQLRVHMQMLGHPILGDKFYAAKDTPQAARLLLHARQLTLTHPDSGERVTFLAECPF